MLNLCVREGGLRASELRGMEPRCGETMDGCFLVLQNENFLNSELRSVVLLSEESRIVAGRTEAQKSVVLLNEELRNVSQNGAQRSVVLLNVVLLNEELRNVSLNGAQRSVALLNEERQIVNQNEDQKSVALLNEELRNVNQNGAQKSVVLRNEELRKMACEHAVLQNAAHRRSCGVPRSGAFQHLLRVGAN